MNENQQKAFDFAADLSKQLITISTAIITLTVTFSKDVLGNNNTINKGWLVCSWSLLIISIISGIWTLMALTGNLDPISTKENKPEPILTITSPNITLPTRIQVITFILALATTCIYGHKELNVKSNNTSRQGKYIVIRKSILGRDTTVYQDTLYLDKK